MSNNYYHQNNSDASCADSFVDFLKTPQGQIMYSVLENILGPVYIGIKQRKREANRQQREAKGENPTAEAFTFNATTGQYETRKVYGDIVDIIDEEPISSAKDADTEAFNAGVLTQTYATGMRGEDRIYNTLESLAKDYPTIGPTIKAMYVHNRCVENIGYDARMRGAAESALQDLLAQAAPYINAKNTPGLFIDVYKQAQTILGERLLRKHDD